jgi:glucose uptake protein
VKEIMYLPQSYQVALLFMVASMLCWGSWANTMKLCPGYRFQLFYWDYIIGLFAGTLLLGATLGSAGTIGFPFLADIQNASRTSIVYAIAGGAVFNIANLLLVAAIEVAGMAVAFPVGTHANHHRDYLRLAGISRARNRTKGRELPRHGS